MIAREKHAESLGPGTHGSTFGGNPLIAAAGLASLTAIIEDGVIDNCVAMGSYLRTRLEQLKDKHPFIVEVRGRGLLLGMELAMEGGEIVKTALSRGLLINCTVGNVLRFVPPLIVTKSEIDQMIEILSGIFAEI